MIKFSACALCGLLSFYLAISAPTTVLADGSVAPVRLDPDKIAGLWADGDSAGCLQGHTGWRRAEYARGNAVLR